MEPLFTPVLPRSLCQPACPPPAKNQCAFPFQEPMTNREAPTTSCAGHHLRSSRKLISPWGTGATPTCSELCPSPVPSTCLSIQMTDISALTPRSPPAPPGLFAVELDPVLAFGLHPDPSSFGVRCPGFGFGLYWGRRTSSPRNLIFYGIPSCLAGSPPVCFCPLIPGLVARRLSGQRHSRDPLGKGDSFGALHSCHSDS